MKKSVYLLIFSLLLGQADQAIMTLYKDGFALVKQPVNWPNVPAGVSTLEYNQLPSRLFMDSPFLTLQDEIVVRWQRINSNIFSGEKFFSRKLGKYVEIKISGGKTYEGILLEYNNAKVTLQGKSEVLSIPRDKIELIITEDRIENPQFKPTLIWEINLEKPMQVQGELIYLSGGFDWNAVYRLVMNGKDNQANLVPEAIISNRSDVDFSDLTLQLVEGELHRAGQKKISSLGQQFSRAQSSRVASSSVSADQKSLGDYHIYALSEVLNFMGDDNITVQLYNPRVINYEKTYIFENKERSQREEPLVVELKIINSEKNGLGIPLPAGKVEMYLTSKGGSLEFSGEDYLVQTPKEGTVLLTAGRAFDITGKRTILNYDRQRNSEEASIQIQIKNIHDEDIQVRVIEHISGDWVIRDASSMYTKEDATTIYFPLNIDAEDNKIITNTYRKEWK